ncbi:MAG: nucleotide exchange factor GrpE [Planctomycetota bacterium]
MNEVENFLPDEFLPEPVAAEEPAVADAADDAVYWASELSEAVSSQLQPLREGLAGLQRQFDQKIMLDQVRQQQLDKLHAEVQEHRGDLLLKTLQPMAVDMIRLADDISRLATVHRQRVVDNQHAQELVALLEGLSVSVCDILDRYGFESFVGVEAAFDAKRQRVQRRIVVADAAQHLTVADRVRPGFMYAGRLLRPELVNVAVFEPVAAPPKTSAEPAAGSKGQEVSEESQS